MHIPGYIPVNAYMNYTSVKNIFALIRVPTYNTASNSKARKMNAWCKCRSTAQPSPNSPLRLRSPYGGFAGQASAQTENG